MDSDDDPIYVHLQACGGIQNPFWPFLLKIPRIQKCAYKHISLEDFTNTITSDPTKDIVLPIGNEIEIPSITWNGRPFEMWFLDIFPTPNKPAKHLSLDPPVPNPAFEYYSKYQESWKRSAKTRFIKKTGFIAHIGTDYESFRATVSDPDNDHKLDTVIFLGLGTWSDADAQKTIDLIDRTSTLCYFCQIPVPVNQEIFNNFLGLMILLARGVRMTPILKLDNVPVPTGVTILKGEGLAAADFNGKSDPYCVYGLAQKLGAWTKGNGPYKTKVKDRTLNPVWGPNDRSSNNLDFLGHPHSHLMIEVFDKDLTGSDRLGYVSMPVNEVTVGEHKLKVKPVKNEKATGTITINITSSKFGLGNIVF